MELIDRIEKGKGSRAVQVKKAIAAIDEADKVLNVLDEKVAPYAFWMPMRELLKNIRDFDRYTKYSQDVMVEELNGCIDIVNRKIRLYHEADVTVRLLFGKHTGETRVYKESTAQEVIEMGLAELA